MVDHTRPACRKRAIAWAQEIAANPLAVFLDTETTGLGDDAEICDLAIVDRGGLVLMDSLVRPAHPIPSEAAAIHGITDEMVEDAPEFWTISADLAAVLGGRRVCVYNAPYDSGVINRLCTRHGLPEIACDWQDALKAFSEFHGAPGKFGMGFKWHKLDAAAAHFGIDPGGHRALADAQVTRLVVLAMAAAT